MIKSFSRLGSAATAAVPTHAAAGETSSDELLIQRIANGDRLAMQVLFARHRTPVYRWLLRFVSQETPRRCGARPAGSKPAPRSPRG